MGACGTPHPGSAACTARPRAAPPDRASPRCGAVSPSLSPSRRSRVVVPAAAARSCAVSRRPSMSPPESAPCCEAQPP
ncbi:hypothetical protein KL919_000486 [Ogataea angusta]|nr:hypothetical protein KL919_000486 [Ogataea angusta]